MLSVRQAIIMGVHEINSLGMTVWTVNFEQDKITAMGIFRMSLVTLTINSVRCGGGGNAPGSFNLDTSTKSLSVKKLLYFWSS